MSALSPILPVLREYYQRADWTKEAARYVKSEGLDLDEINAHAGIMTVLPLSFKPNGLFDLAGGVPGAVIEVYAEDAETTIDLCAWPIARPDTFATAIRVASILGCARVTNPATWAFGNHLRIHKTPLDWLKACCQGACILDYCLAGFELGQALGPLLAADAQHAAELRKFLCRSPVDPRNIIYPRNAISKAA